MLTRVALWCHILIILNALVLMHSVKTWGSTQLFPSSKIPDSALNTQRAVVRRKIVLYHNFFRTKVQPTASNMLLMSWHKGAAYQAQQYAERCVFLKHNPSSENTVPQLGICGQNLFAASKKTPWFFAIKSWFIEYQNFTYGAPNPDIHTIGHYTQMVWAMSHKVGCGIAHCPGGPWGSFYNFVCHYCPAGNHESIVQFPYKVGTPCGDCSTHCVSDALCTNACMKQDYFNNCDELLHTAPGVCSQGYCNATCSCNSRLHKNYPF